MNVIYLRLTQRGFTLIELMMVAAIIGLLASIAIPKFANLITKSQESSIKGQLGAVRSAVTIYYADTEGLYPTTLGAMTTKYIAAIPFIKVPTVAAGSGHPNNNGATNAINDANANRWAYFSATGLLRVNCTHADTKGSTWSTW